MTETNLIVLFSAASIGAVISFFVIKIYDSKKTKTLIEAIKQLARDCSPEKPAKLGGQAKNLYHVIRQIFSKLKTDITESENQRTKLDVVLDHLSEGVIAVDSCSRILLINPSAQMIFETLKKDALGKSLLEIVRNETLDNIVRQAIRAKVSLRNEIELLPRHQKKILHVTAIGIDRPADEKVSGILVLSDITEIKQLENTRREFVANVSHELRTPLTSISGFVETLLSSSEMEPKRACYFLKLMEEDASRLGRLIDDLLELSKIESKSVPLKLEAVNLAEEVSKAILSLESSWKQRKIKIRNHVLENQMFIVKTDRDQIKQVFLNLLDNAIKFNKDGGEVFVEGRNENSHVIISIRDTGVGIPEELIPRIFERFFRVDKARSRELGGTGLGLSIVKHITESYGGSITCKSTLGGGSEFLFSLPV